MKRLEKKLNKLFFFSLKNIAYYSNKEYPNAKKITDTGQTWSIGGTDYIIENKQLYAMFKDEIDQIFLKNIWNFISRNYSFSSTADVKRISIWETQFSIHQRIHEFVGKRYKGDYEDILADYRTVNPNNNDIWFDIKNQIQIYAEKIYSHKFMDEAGCVFKPDTIIHRGKIFSYDSWEQKLILPEVERQASSSWKETLNKITGQDSPVYFSANNWKWNDDLFIPDSIECETPTETGNITTCLVG